MNLGKGPNFLSGSSAAWTDSNMLGTGFCKRLQHIGRS